MNRPEDFSHHDTVLVKGLRLDASIGVFEWEKQIKQTLVFDAQLFCDFTQSARTDAIEDAVDYAAVCASIERTVSKRHYQLLEFLAEQLCQQLLANFALSAVSLVIYKPGAVTNTEYVGVRIFRSNGQASSSVGQHQWPDQKDGA